MTQITHNHKLALAIKHLGRLAQAQRDLDLAVGYDAVDRLLALGFEGHALRALWVDRNMTLRLIKNLKAKLNKSISDSASASAQGDTLCTL